MVHQRVVVRSPLPLLLIFGLLDSGCTGVQPMPQAVPPGKVTGMPDGTFSVECAGFEAVAAQQKDPAWCWAACAQMIYALNHRTVKQEELAARIHGVGRDNELIRKAASYFEVMLALYDKDFKVPYEKVIEVLAKVMDPHFDPKINSVEIDFTPLLGALAEMSVIQNDELIEDMSRGQLIAAGQVEGGDASSGHVYAVHLLTAEQYNPGFITKIWNSMAESVGLKPTKYPLKSVKRYDPSNGEVDDLGGESFRGQANFVINKRIATDILHQLEKCVVVSGRDPSPTAGLLR